MNTLIRLLRGIGTILLLIVVFLLMSFVLKQFVLIPAIGLLGISEKSALLVRHSVTIPLLIVVYIIVARLFRRRRISEIALLNFPKEAGGGFILGAGAMGLVLGILASSGYYRITSAGSWNVLPEIVIPVIMLALTEELIFRGIFYRNLEKTIGAPLALIISGILFGILHITNTNVNVLGIVSATLGGLFLCMCFSLTRRLWLPTFFHIGWNLMQPLFGVRISGEDELIPVFMSSTLEGPTLLTGGRFGPESSILALGILGLLISWGISKIRSKNRFGK